MRHVPAAFSASIEPSIHRVASLGSIVSEWTPNLNFLVIAHNEAEKAAVEQLRLSGLTNIAWVESATHLVSGDVVKPDTGNGTCLVLFRETDLHHAVLMTNQCNSNCLMCSQPPTSHDDSWLASEALDIVRHIGKSPRSVGISGGEPLLQPSSLRSAIDQIAVLHPTTRIDVLTNGRLLANKSVFEPLLDNLAADVNWLIPLYGHADFLHDFVVQSRGAFDQTINGLLNLQERSQYIQLRVVLIKPVLRTLTELCEFIGRNLPFVGNVALMVTEPVGFALANRDQCEVELRDWHAELAQSASVLNRHAVPFVFMNAPLCSLPRELWPYAQQSISDWKNVYVDECESCCVRSKCTGLFAWHERGWKPTKLTAIARELI